MMDAEVNPVSGTSGANANHPLEPQPLHNVKEQFGLKDIQQLCLQFFLEKSCVLEGEFDKLVGSYKTRCVPDHAGQIDKNTLLTNANKDFRSYGFSIKRVFDEITEKTYYMLINEENDTLRYQNSWSQHENKFFYRLIDDIIAVFLNSDADNLSREDISIVVTPSMSRNAGLTGATGENVLKQWIGQHWFEEVDTEITFGVRTLAEMIPYFKKFKLKTCSVCSLLCLIGRLCPKCNQAIHDYCYVGHSGPSSSQIKCLTCNTSLTNCHPLKPQNES